MTVLAALVAGALLVQVIPGVTVDADAAPAVARYFGDLAVEAGEAQWVDGELVPATLDLWAYLALAECESGGDWHIDSHPYRGGLQFLPSTWRAVGGAGDPASASVAEQIDRARMLVDRAGWGQWPVCSRRVGLS